MSEPQTPLRDQITAAMIRVFAPDRILLKPEELRIIDELATAVLGVIQQPDHAAGPTVREAAANDRRWWNGEKTGDQP